MGLTKPRAAQIYNLDYKQATRVVTVTNITLSGGAPASVDGVSLSVNDRILVAGQTTGSQNGLYLVSTLGSGSNGTWVRTGDANDTGEIEAGMIVMVTEGVIYADTQWKLITNDPITIGSTALTFTQNYSANSISGGTSNVTVYSNSDVTISSAGTANVLTVSSTGTVVTGTASVTGNITAGNILTAGLISATANVTGGNIIGVSSIRTVGFISATGNTIGGNVNTSGIVSATGNVIGGNVNTSGLISATANVTGGNVLTSGLVSATANVTGGNITTAGQVSATGNITGSYFLGNVACASGIYASRIFNGNSEANIGTSGGNANISIGGTSNVAVFASTGEYVTGLVSATGNVIGGNIITGGIVSVAGNIVATTITTTTGSNGNLTLDPDGVGDVVLPTNTELFVLSTAAANSTTTGAVQVTGGIGVQGNVYSGSQISATANVTGGNLLTAGIVSATGSINSDSNVIAGTNTKSSPAIFYTNSANTQYGALLMQKGSVERWLIGSDNSTGNGNIVIRFNAITNYVTVTEAGAMIVGSNITGGNLLTSGSISATANITGGNILTAGIMSSAGNATHGNILTAGIVSATGNVTGNYILGNGSQLTGLPATYGNSNVVTLLAGFGSNTVSTTGNITGGNLITSGLISTVGNLYLGTGNAGYIYGNGTYLTGISAAISVSKIENGNSNVWVQTSGGDVTVTAGGVSNVAVFSTGSMTLQGAVGTPKTISANVVIAPNINGMLIGPLTFANGVGMTVPTSSTVYVYAP
jgi:hypothetical protein